MPSERRLTAGGGVGCPQGINTGKHAVSIESLVVAKGGHNVSRWGAAAAAGARGACPRPPPRRPVGDHMVGPRKPNEIKRLRSVAFVLSPRSHPGPRQR